ncbi:MAG: hypothetical protein C4290_09860, partial [Chloroflexota bacterium]
MMQHSDQLRARLREALGVRPPALPARPPERWAPTAEDEVHHLLPGFWQDTPAGRVFVIERRFDLEHRHGRLA